MLLNYRPHCGQCSEGVNLYKMNLQVFYMTLLLLGQCFLTFAQIKCGTNDPSESERRELLSFYDTYLLKQKKAKIAKQEIYKVAVRANIIYSTTSNDGLTDADVRSLIQYANAYLINANIELYLLDNQTYIVREDKFVDLKISDEVELRRKYDVFNAINIYFARSITDVNQAILGGYASLPNLSNGSNRILYSYFNRTAEDFELLRNKLFLHEIGHYFGLLHTFQDSNSPDINKRELVTRGIGANCATTGDQICDTAADPFERLPAIAAYSCFDHVPNDLLDANGERFLPPTNNLMSYHQRCGNIFTEQQYQKMQASFAVRFSPSAEYQVVARIPNFVVINGTDRKTYCNGDSVKVNFRTNGLFERDNQYLVELSDNSGKNFQRMSARLIGNQLAFKLPSVIAEGDNYRVRVIATRPETTSPISENFSIRAYASTFISTNKTEVEAGGSVEVSVSFTGTGPWDFTLSDGTSHKSIKQNPYIFNRTIYQNTAFWISSASNVCGNAVRYGSSTVNLIEPQIQTTALTTPYLCQGQNLSLSITSLGRFTGSNQFVIQISDRNGVNFTDLQTQVSTFSLVARIPDNFPAGSTYRVKVVEKSSQLFSAVLGPITVSEAPQPPKVNSPAVYCESNASQLLEATGQGLRWYQNETDVKYFTAVLSPTSKVGNYTYFVSQTNINGCESKRSKLDVIVKPLANATISGNHFINPRDSVLLNVMLTGDSPWEFTLSDNRVFKTQKDVNQIYVKPSKSTDYSLKEVKNICGYGNTFGVAKVTVLQPLSSEDELFSNTKIYPNPTSEKLNIELKLNPNSSVEFSIFDINGRAILQKKQKINEYPQKEEINLSGLNSGEYLLRISTNQYNTTRKIIVQK